MNGYVQRLLRSYTGYEAELFILFFILCTRIERRIGGAWSYHGRLVDWLGLGDM